MIRITQIKISIDEPVSKVKSLVLKKLRLQEADLLDYRIYKESIDARHRGEIDFIYTVDIKLKDESKILSKKIKNVSLAPELDYVNPQLELKKWSTAQSSLDLALLECLLLYFWLKMVIVQLF